MCSYDLAKMKKVPHVVDYDAIYYTLDDEDDDNNNNNKNNNKKASFPLSRSRLSLSLSHWSRQEWESKR